MKPNSPFKVRVVKTLPGTNGPFPIHWRITTLSGVSSTNLSSDESSHVIKNAILCALPDSRKFSHPTATISKGGMATLLRSLSISGAKPGGLVPPGQGRQHQQPPTALQSMIHQPGCGEGAGEGLGMSPPHTSSTTPVIADQAPGSSNQSAPNSPSSYAEGRSRKSGCLTPDSSVLYHYIVFSLPLGFSAFTNQCDVLRRAAVHTTSPTGT